MSEKTYDSADTALLVVDPYNDFMSEGGKLYDQIKDVADSVDMFGNLRKLIPAARSAGLKIFVLPHRSYREGDYENWRQWTGPQKMVRDKKVFERGTWGGEFHPEFGPQRGDVVVHEHWAQSSFANTDLDLQLKQHGIRKIILVGMVANTCIESTGRFGMELGYHVTLVKDATAAFSREAMQAALEVNWPTFAHAILTTPQLLAEIGSARRFNEYHDNLAHMSNDMNSEQNNGGTAATQGVLTHHLDCFGKGDLTGTMTDYTDESKFFTPDGLFRGPEAIRRFYAGLFEEFAKPGMSFELLKKEVCDDTAYIVWKAETADNHFEVGTDTFIVREGKILTQTFAGKISPKP